MTLVEVMVAMSILTFAAAALMALALHARRVAHGNLLEMSAQVCAQAYMEQLKGIDYSSLRENANPAAIPTRFSANDNSGADSLLPQAAWPAQTDLTGTNCRLLDYRNTPDSTGDDLLVQFAPVLRNLANTASGLRCYEITLNYRWRSNDLASGRARWRQNSLRSMRSNIPQ